MNKQTVIGYDNVFTAGTLTASTSPEGGEKENAVDGFTYDFWSPSGSGPHTLTVTATAGSPGPAVDYFAYHAHNLHDVGGTIALQGSDDGSNWTTLSGPHTPTENKPALHRFTSVTYGRYRVLMTGSGAKVGVLQAGVALVMDSGLYVGAAPGHLNRTSDILNQESEGGQFLGRSLIRQGASFEIAFDRLTPAWVRTYWLPFAEHAETTPFFISWRYSPYPDEVMYAWSTADARAEHNHQSFMRVSMPVVGQA